MSTVLSPEAEVLSRAELLETIDELSGPLGYAPGEFMAQAEAGTLPDTPETSEILVLAHLLT